MKNNKRDSFLVRNSKHLHSIANELQYEIKKREKEIAQLECQVLQLKYEVEHLKKLHKKEDSEKESF